MKTFMFKTFAQCVGLSGGRSGEFKLLTTLKNVYFGEVTFWKTNLQDVALSQKTGSAQCAMPNKTTL